MPVPGLPMPAAPGNSDRQCRTRSKRAIRCARRMISTMMAGFSRLTAQQVNEQTFARALRGYAMHEVDDFLDQVAREVLRWQDALAQGYRPSMRLVTPQDVNEKLFAKVVRGYAMVEVDAFLDELTEELAFLQDQDPQAQYR